MSRGVTRQCSRCNTRDDVRPDGMCRSCRHTYDASPEQRARRRAYMRRKHGHTPRVLP